MTQNVLIGTSTPVARYTPLASLARLSIYFLIASIIAFGKDFVYLGIDTPFARIYITEIFLAFNIILIAIEMLRGGIKPRSGIWLWFLSLILYGGILAAVSFSQHGMLAIRHYAMIYYCLTAIIVYLLFDIRDIKTMLLVITAASIARLAFHVTWLALPWFPLSNIGPLTVNANIIALVALFYYLFGKSRSIKTFAAVLLFFTLAHSWIRPSSSQLVAFAVVLLSFAAFHLLGPHRSRIDWKKAALVAGGVVLVTVLAFLAVYILLQGGNFDRLWAEVNSILHPKLEEEGKTTGEVYMIRSQRNNTLWRAAVWRKALEQLSNQPLFGTGLGSVFTAPRLATFPKNYDYTKNIDPHNSYIQLLMRTGLIGFLLFALPHLLMFKRAFAVTRHGSAQARNRLAPWLLMFTGITVITFFNVVLENPYGAIVYWYLFGAILISTDEEKE